MCESASENCRVYHRHDNFAYFTISIIAIVAVVKTVTQTRSYHNKPVCCVRVCPLYKIPAFALISRHFCIAISKKSWIFLILSGLATGASWLCYYRALQIGEASKVVPIDKLSVVFTLVLAFVFLHEQFTIKSVIGCILIGAGTLFMVL